VIRLAELIRIFYDIEKITRLTFEASHAPKRQVVVLERMAWDKSVY